MRISTQLIISFSIILCITIGLGVFALWELAQVHQASVQHSEQWSVNVYSFSNIKVSLAHFRVAQNRHLLATNNINRAEQESVLNALEKKINAFVHPYESHHLYENTTSSREKDLYAQFTQLWAIYLQKNDKFLSLSQQNQDKNAQVLLQRQMGRLFDNINGVLSKLVHLNLQGGQAATDYSAQVYQHSIIFVITVILIAIALSIIIAVIIIQHLTHQIGGEPNQIAQIAHKVSLGDFSVELNEGGSGIYASVKTIVANLCKVADIADAISRGNLSRRVELKTDKDLLGMALNKMLDTFKDIVKRANVIAQGDYSADIKPRSEDDELGSALQLMTQSLRDNARQTEELNWVKDGLSRLSQKVSGNLSLIDLCRQAIHLVAHHVQAGQGVLYVFDKETNTLKLYGTYAFVERDELSHQYLLGEGVVGQVALEKKPILLKNISRHQTVITTGTVSAAPLNTYTLPLLFEDSLYGVMELATFEAFTELKQEFITQAAGIIATSVYSTQQAEQVKRLLENAEQSAQQARARAEEIEKVNLELEAQRQQIETQAAEALKRNAEIEAANTTLEAQQQQLQQQSQMLQGKNAQLEKQQQQLQIQAEEMRARNQALEETKAELDRRAQDLSRANQYKSDFLANMSHELRTPLNSIILLSKMLSQNQQNHLTEQEVKRALVIHQSGNELLRLINDILDLSKIEAGKMVLNINDFHSQALLEEMRDMFESIALDKGLDFIIEDQAQCQMHQDQHKIAQILRNFLSNALKFTKQGTVTLKITLSGSNSIAFSVADTGIGIPKEKQQRVFEAFEQVDGSISREFGGTGLGLSIANKLAKLLHGHISLTSTEGQGTEFSLILPIFLAGNRPIAPTETLSTVSAKPTALPKPAVASVSITSAGSSATALDDRHNLIETDKTILIIEDDLLFAKSVAELIHEMAFKTLIATCGEEGLSLAKQFKPHGIILDLGLPDMEGNEVLQILKNTPELRHIPVEIVSVRDTETDFLKQGAIGFLQKPSDAGQFNRAIEHLIQVSEKSPKEVLLVEDNQLQQEVIRDLLTARDEIKMISVGREDEALREINKGCYDLVIVDLGLEQGDGFTVSNYIREHFPELPIIVYTARDMTVQEEQRLHQSVQHIIHKDKDSDEQLLAQVSLFLHRLQTPVFETSAVAVESVPQEATVSASVTPAPVDNLAGKNILVVDDDIKNAFVIGTALEDYDINLLHALDGKKALEMLHQHPVDLVLMDIMMPGMSGYEVMHMIREDAQLCHLPMIAVTAKASPKDREQCLAAGANDYLSKPLDYDELVQLVNKWCRQGNNS
jgi:signal transduction histidine kinase/DNA-binding response OmpR family regulator